MAKADPVICIDKDHYRDVMVRGGIPQVAFGNWMQGKLGKEYFIVLLHNCTELNVPYYVLLYYSR